MNEHRREQGNVAYNRGTRNMAYTYTSRRWWPRVSVWYYCFYNSDDNSLQMGLVEGPRPVRFCAPLNPTISDTMITSWIRTLRLTVNRGKNHYIKLALGHSFKLVEGASWAGLSAANFNGTR